MTAKLGRRKRQKLLDLIRKHDDPMLKTVCTLDDDEDRPKRIALMKAVLEATIGIKGGRGVGIAAPQCGFKDRVIIVHEHYKPWPIEPYAMIDPVCVPIGDFKQHDMEGCLSYPGVQVDIERHRDIHVVWHNERGEIRGSNFTDFDARVIQHEIDHLNGICLVGDEWRERGAA